MASDGQLDLTLAPAPRKALSVFELVRLISGALEANLDEFWVTGEVSNARIPVSGHLYFTLKDDRSSISVVMFKGAYSRLKFRVADGMAILVRGRANLFEARGQLQVIAAALEPRGAGALQLAFEQLKKRLAGEGLFDDARKRPLPFLPRVIGIVTARSGAGLRDILRVLGDRYPDRHLIFRPALVQGESAASDIAAAIEDLNRDGRAEVLIVGRGGGSLEDLWAFNEEAVARAIFRSAIPIISAVGHEIDYTIADFVADVRAPTPTAAAQMVVPAKAELAERVSAAAESLAVAMARTLEGLRESLDDYATRLRHPGAMLADAREAVARAVLSLARAMRARARENELGVNAQAGALGAAGAKALAAGRSRVAELAARMDSMSPLKVLERGYAVVTSARDGRVVVDAATAGIGDELDIRLMKGRLSARVIARGD
ncbi:MAG TPA: exodeoxyribonuclease VII large subunit [Candidatus Binataceae bacterium]|nr:exodeoxyribonuclease VII large subunit [Candidatus Binataceae bacterium]